MSLKLHMTHVFIGPAVAAAALLAVAAGCQDRSHPTSAQSEVAAQPPHQGKGAPPTDLAGPSEPDE
jgi:hypothetical protein